MVRVTCRLVLMLTVVAFWLSMTTLVGLVCDRVVLVRTPGATWYCKTSCSKARFSVCFKKASSVWSMRLKAALLGANIVMGPIPCTSVSSPAKTSNSTSVEYSPVLAAKESYKFRAALSGKSNPLVM